MKIGGRGEGEGGVGYSTGVNRAQSLDKQGDTLIAHNSILQSTTLNTRTHILCEDIGVRVVQDLLKLFFCHFTVGWRVGRGEHTMSHTQTTHCILYIYSICQP